MNLDARRVVPVVVALVAIFVFRVGFSASQELSLARGAFVRGDRQLAVDHYRRALRFHLPVFCKGDEAIDALFAISRSAEAEGDRALALSSVRSIRAGILASRSFYVPHRDALARADRDIVRLVALEPRAAIDGARSPSEVAMESLTLLESTPRGRSGFLFVTLLGLGLFVYAAYVFVSRGLDEHDRLVPRVARHLAGLFALGIALFLVGLAFT